jgi:hypothetical protein
MTEENARTPEEWTALLEKEYKDDPVWPTVEVMRTQDGATDERIYNLLESFY